MKEASYCPCCRNKMGGQSSRFSLYGYLKKSNLNLKSMVIWPEFSKKKGKKFEG